VWHFRGSDAVSHHILAVAHEVGGQVFGAFEGDRMIGFALAFPAIHHGQVHLHSHMAAVLPEFQDRGIGRMLKLAQREDALLRGIKRIEWTFDPLQTRNANFNINRLGAIVRRYIPNFYGESSSPLHANLPTDRLVAEWHLDSERVRSRVAGARPEISAAANAPTIAIPANINALRSEDPSNAAAVQATVRDEFLRRFEQGFAVTRFTTNETHGTYHLEKYDAN
jgi:predicted GNAT superfamily acetyltransferase